MNGDRNLRKALENDYPRMPEYMRGMIEQQVAEELNMDSGNNAVRETGSSTYTGRKIGGKTGRKYLHFFRSQAAAAACVIVIAGAGITAAAAGYHVWSRGMQGTIQATPEEQQSLIDQGIAVASDSSSSDEAEADLSDLAVTNNGITIVPETVITDDRYAYISFSVQGYDLPEGEEPFFENTDVILETEATRSITGSFYDGTIMDESGKAVNEDGSEIKTDGEGRLIKHYADKEGNLEYVMTIYQDDSDGVSLVGQTIHVTLSNLGTVTKTDFIPGVEGDWNFTIDLPKVSAAKTISAGKPVEGTDFVLDSVEISPISIRMNFSSDATHTINEDSTGIPSFRGFVLKNGTKLLFLAGGGSIGWYTDDTLTDAYSITQFARVIDPDQVAAVLINPSDTYSEDYVEVSLAQ